MCTSAFVPKIWMIWPSFRILKPKQAASVSSGYNTSIRNFSLFIFSCFDRLPFLFLSLLCVGSWICNCLSLRCINMKYAGRIYISWIKFGVHSEKHLTRAPGSTEQQICRAARLQVRKCSDAYGHDIWTTSFDNFFNLFENGIRLMEPCTPIWWVHEKLGWLAAEVWFKNTVLLTQTVPVRGNI